MLPAIRNNLKFEVMLEVAQLGALDDIVFTCFTQSAVTRHFLQLKHNTENEELNNGSLFNMSGPIQPWLYFDDWFLFVSGYFNKLPPPLSPLPKGQGPELCVFYTNRPMDAGLGALFTDPDDLGYRSLRKEIVGNPSHPVWRKLVEQFDRYSTLTERALRIAEEQQKNKNNSKQQQDDKAEGDDQSIDDPMLKANKQNPTKYRAAEYIRARGAMSRNTLDQHMVTFFRQHFRLADSRPSADELEDVVRKKLKSCFSDIPGPALEPVFDMLVSEVWRWFRVLRKAEVWTNTTVIDHVKRFMKLCSTLPQLAGASQYALGEIAKSLGSEDSPWINRETLLTALTTPLSNVNQRILCWYGITDVGKSCCLAVCLQRSTKIKSGEYLYFSNSGKFLAAVPKLSSGVGRYLRLICVDGLNGTSELDPVLVDALVAVAKYSRLLLLARSESVPKWSVNLPNLPPHLINIPPLSDNEILEHLRQRSLTDKVVQIGARRHALLHKDESGERLDPGMQEVMSMPRSLLKLCKLTMDASPMESVPSASPLNSQYVHNSLEPGVEYVPLRARRCLPLYSISTILFDPSLTGSKCIVSEQSEFSSVLRSIKEKFDDRQKRHAAGSKGGQSSGASDRRELVEIQATHLDKSVIDIRAYLSGASGNKKQLFEQGNPTVLLDPDGKCASWSSIQQKRLFDISHIILLTSVRLEASCHTFERDKREGHSERRVLYKPVLTTTFRAFPPGDDTMSDADELALMQELDRVQRDAGITLITAEGGAGKSTVLKVIRNQFTQHINDRHRSDNPHEIPPLHVQYSHAIFLPFRSLAVMDIVSGSSRALLDVVCNELGVSHDSVLRPIVESDLRRHRVLFLLDAWDEVTMVERSRRALSRLLHAIADYGHAIVTTRPLDQSIEALKATAVYALNHFSPNDVERFIQTFYGSYEDNAPVGSNDNDKQCEKMELDDTSESSGPDSTRAGIIKDFTDRVLAFIQNRRDVFDAIGLPLQCYLLCQAFKPSFLARLYGQLSSASSVTDPLDSGLRRHHLYRLFVISRLRKLLYVRFRMSHEPDKRLEVSLVSESTVCTLSHKYVAALQDAAYSFLFQGKIPKLGEDSFAKDLGILQLLDDRGFRHQTYAEYLAALFLAHRLQSCPQQTVSFISARRYQTRFSLVFEFLSGISSYGDSFCSYKPSVSWHLWSALLKAPQDVLGIVSGNLLTSCKRHTKDDVFAQLFPGVGDTDATPMLSQHGNAGQEGEQPRHRRDEGGDDLNFLLDIRAQRDQPTRQRWDGANDSTGSGEFKPPQLDHAKFVREKAMMVKNVKLNELNGAGVTSFKQWLLALTNQRSSKGLFLVQQAVAEQLGAVGHGDNEIVGTLVGLLTRRYTTGKALSDPEVGPNRARCSALESLALIHATWPTMTSGPNQADERSLSQFIASLASKLDDINHDQLEWFASLPPFIEQPLLLLQSLQQAENVDPTELLNIMRVQKAADMFDADVKSWLKDPRSGDAELSHFLRFHLATHCTSERSEWVSLFLAEICKFDADTIVSSGSWMNLILSRVWFVIENGWADSWVKSTAGGAWVKLLSSALNQITGIGGGRTLSIEKRAASIVICLARIKIDRGTMESLLTDVLSPQNHNDFWDYNVIRECRDALLPFYWCRPYADYVVEATNPHGKRRELQELLGSRLSMHDLNEEQHSLLVDALLSVFSQMSQATFHDRKRASYVQQQAQDAISYASDCDAYLLCAIVSEQIASAPAGDHDDDEKSADCRIRRSANRPPCSDSSRALFLSKCLRVQQCALTLRENGFDVHLASETRSLSCSPALVKCLAESPQSVPGHNWKLISAPPSTVENDSNAFSLTFDWREPTLS